MALITPQAPADLLYTKVFARPKNTGFGPEDASHEACSLFNGGSTRFGTTELGVASMIAEGSSKVFCIKNLETVTIYPVPQNDGVYICDVIT